MEFKSDGVKWAVSQSLSWRRDVVIHLEGYRKSFELKEGGGVTIWSSYISLMAKGKSFVTLQIQRQMYEYCTVPLGPEKMLFKITISMIPI